MMATLDNLPQLPPSLPSKYGLEGEIVEVVEDRGEQTFRSDIATRANIPTDPTHQAQTILLKNLPDKLIHARKDSVYHKRAYMPRQKFDELMNFSQVVSIIKELGFPDDHNQLASRICLGRDHDPPCRKLLASLVGIKRGDLIKSAMDDNMGDDCFPLNLTPGDTADLITCQIDGHDHGEFNKQLDSTDRGNLITYTYHLTAVFLRQLPDKHFHYKLDSADHLPMRTLGQVVENLETKQVTVSRDAPTGSGQYAHLGGFGQVFKVEIDPSHYHFVSKVDQGSGDERSPPRFFALKKLNDTRANVFEEELKSLLYCLHHKFADKGLLDEGQKHMAHVRASFEIQNKINGTTNYYFIFDWQEGNLSQFWEKEGHLREDENYPKSMAEQIFGLSAALLLVHNDRNAQRPADPQRQTVYGRHGDLSPSNILYSITRDGKYLLKLADFGLAQIHSRETRTFGNSKKPGRTETYRGPEFDIKGGKISRATDMFSFGCVLLEYITWYLLGPRAVSEFSDSRLGPEAHRGINFRTDVYWTLPSTTSQISDAKLKTQVHAHIERLKADSRCSWFLCQMLDLIAKRMLHPDPNRRITSSHLTRTLYAFRETCEDDRDYYTKCWKSTPMKGTWRQAHDRLLSLVEDAPSPLD